MENETCHLENDKAISSPCRLALYISLNKYAGKGVDLYTKHRKMSHWYQSGTIYLCLKCNIIIKLFVLEVSLPRNSLLREVGKTLNYYRQNVSFPNS